MAFSILGSLTCPVIFQINFEKEKLFNYLKEIAMFATQI